MFLNCQIFLFNTFENSCSTSSNVWIIVPLSCSFWSNEILVQFLNSYSRVLLFPVVNSYHRFLIHKVVEDFPELHSFSIGQDPNRRTVVTKVKRQASIHEKHGHLATQNSLLWINIHLALIIVDFYWWKEVENILKYQVPVIYL